MLRISDALHGKGVHALRDVFTNTDDPEVVGSASVDSEALRVSLPLQNLRKLQFLEVDWPIQIAEVKGKISLPTQLVLLRCARPDLLLNPGLHNHLAVLHLSRLKYVPSSIGQLSSLAFLRFRYCDSLQSLPESFGQLRALRDLQFQCYESLQSLPESFGELGALRNLQIKWCKSLENLPESFGQLSSLERLVFQDCSIHSLPESIGQFSALTHLLFNDRVFRSRSKHGSSNLSESFGQLTKLQSLSLHLLIEGLPNTMKSFVNLRCLKLSYWSATNIPDFIRRLPSLHFVEIFDAQRIVHPWPIWLVVDGRRHLYGQQIYQVFEERDGNLFLIEEGPTENTFLKYPEGFNRACRTKWMYLTF